MPRIVKLIGMAIAGLLLAFTALGLVLPRDMRVERRLELHAPAAAVAAQVNDLTRWQAWAFGPEAAACTFDAATESLRWTCGEAEGSLVRTDLSPEALWVDAHVGGSVARVRMKLSVMDAPTGAMVIWQEQAQGQRVLGAWLRPWLERARGAEIDKALARLRGIVEPAAGRGT